MKKLLLLLPLLAAGCSGGPPPATAPPSSAQIATISEGGAAVRLEDHLEEGKLTVFEFGAVW